jgi:hypothetical protein
MQPAFHTAAGMSLPFVAGLIRFLQIRRVSKRMLIVLISAMVLCGFWAEIPDIPKYYPKEYQKWEKNLRHSNYADLFFLHNFLDKNETEDEGQIEGTIAIFFMFFLIFFAASFTLIENDLDIYYLKHQRWRRLSKIPPKNL